MTCKSDESRTVLAQRRHQREMEWMSPLNKLNAVPSGRLVGWLPGLVQSQPAGNQGKPGMEHHTPAPLARRSTVVTLQGQSGMLIMQDPACL